MSAFIIRSLWCPWCAWMTDHKHVSADTWQCLTCERYSPHKKGV